MGVPAGRFLREFEERTTRKMEGKLVHCCCRWYLFCGCFYTPYFIFYIRGGLHGRDSLFYSNTRVCRKEKAHTCVPVEDRSSTHMFFVYQVFVYLQRLVPSCTVCFRWVCTRARPMSKKQSETEQKRKRIYGRLSLLPSFSP